MTGLFKRMGSFPLKKEASWVPAGGGGADMRPFRKGRIARPARGRAEDGFRKFHPTP